MTIRAPICSMTGFGSAHRAVDGWDIAVELKSVNGRFLKVCCKAPPNLSRREHLLERQVRAAVRRGSVTVGVFARCSSPERLVAVNEDLVRAYQSAFRRLGLPEDHIPVLPGVIGGSEADEVPEELWEAVVTAADEALERLVEMREREGRVLTEALLGICDRVDALRVALRRRSPQVVVEYQQRLSERVAALLGSTSTPVDPQAVAREVALHAQRGDIAEELDRLESHLSQVRTLLAQGGEQGRTLEFLAQEMHREVSTVGSKSADAELSSHVVSLKAEVERFREQVANVE